MPRFLPLALLAFLCASSRAAEPQPLRRIVFGSCAHQDKPQPIWTHVVAAQPELFLFLGDNIYADTEDMDLMRQQYDKLGNLPGFKKLRDTCQILATWDDHDFGVNDGGADYSKRREAQQLFLDFFNVPKDSPRRKQEGVYSSAVFGPEGKQVQVILLDTRFFRSPLKKKPKPSLNEGPYIANNDSDATILGETQWKWLEAQLRIPAQVRLLCSSIQVVAEDHGWEKWINFPRERARLYKLLRDTKAGGVIILSGDRHLAELSLMEADIGYPLYDLTSSGLTQGFKRWRPQEVNRHRVATMNQGDNFGVVLIDWDRKDPRISLQIRDEDGDITIQQKLALSLLQPDETPAQPSGGNSPAEAAKNVGKEFTLDMVVKATGLARDKSRLFLNSEADFRDAKNFTVVLELRTLADALKEAKIDDPASHYKGKRIRVKGVVSLFQERPQMVVKELKQIEVIEK